MKTIKAGYTDYNLFQLIGAVSLEKQITEERYVEIKQTPHSHKFSRAAIYHVNKVSPADSVFITDKMGVTHTFFLPAINFICFEGDEIMLVWSVGEKNKRGPVIAIKNLNTQQCSFLDTQLKKMYSNHWIDVFFISLTVVAVIACENYLLTIFTMILGFAVAHCIKKYLAYLWADRFKKDFDFEIGW